MIKKIIAFFAQVKTSFTRYKVNDLIAKATTIYTCMLNNKDFPSPLPDLPTLLGFITNLQACQTVVEAGNLAGIKARDKAQADLISALKSIGNYNNFQAQGSAEKLATTGFELYKSGQTVILHAIKAIFVTSIVNTNSISIRVVGAKGAKSFMYQYTTNADKAEGSWISENNTVRKHTFSSLTKGSLVSVRVIVNGSKGQQEVSETISRYVQ